MNTQKMLIKSSLFIATILLVGADFNPQLLAQSLNPSQPDYQKNERSSDGRDALGGFDPLDLIHNSNFRRSRDGSEFQEDTRNNINQAAEEFKRKQREQLENLQNSAPETK
ncbi:hypothetical protein D3800_17410 [Microcystis aeruginosa NIES-298]|uniref:Uncharacterized protein n=1 Tax=Microcystis aeruginosa NIES-298 TaxID=449468 RepID=A0A2H6BQN2_MICAE|nr:MULTISPECIES: hypothetical protein [Microcystis]MDB9403711.1 hypothetical protein [Microcystis sp. CS-574]MDB9545461.1 hypothetical protein [Microcystis aeruginosa CS-1036]QHU84939.1 hypothetical protein D3800_17410 [Microcystis aeruginosa NIES-298]GBD52460.1 hypothetical protein BGM30_15530 [Microcystis aeruginosa NIES-298]GBE97466.1 hypothetical protein NIES298_17140 [Microcystis aeruginosa NIES-298]